MWTEKGGCKHTPAEGETTAQEKLQEVREQSEMWAQPQGQWNQFYPQTPGTRKHTESQEKASLGRGDHSCSSAGRAGFEVALEETVRGQPCHRHLGR